MALPSGCLATTFTWIQHHSAVMGVANSANESLRSQYLADLIAGTQISGIARAGALADPPRLHASRTDGGWIFDGDTHFVSGWGIIDLLQITGSRLSGAFSTGLAIRCARILESCGRSDAAATINAEVCHVRALMDAGLADRQAMSAARAVAADLAYRAAGAVFVAESGAALISGGHGQRLVKEALFAFVTGGPTHMKNALLEQLRRAVEQAPICCIPASEE